VATNVRIDAALVEAARTAGRHRTRREAVEAALRDYLRRRRQLDVVAAFHTFAFVPVALYDYKARR
jgi:Arc/MetJ family transcription regulator